MLSILSLAYQLVSMNFPKSTQMRLGGRRRGRREAELMTSLRRMASFFQIRMRLKGKRGEEMSLLISAVGEKTKQNDVDS